MTGTMDRACFEPGGWVYEFHNGNCRKLAPNVAYVLLGEGRGRNEQRDVTWEEVMAARRERQAERLERIRQPARPAIEPCYVWTFFNRQPIPYYGWYCYLVTRRETISVRGDADHLRASIMTALPLDLLPLAENFEAWMAALARRYPRARRWPGGKVMSGRERDPRKAGTHHGWLKDGYTFSLERPND